MIDGNDLNSNKNVNNSFVKRVLKNTKLLTCLLPVLISVEVSAREIIRLSTYVNESDIRYEGFKKFSELALEKSKGNLIIKVYPSSTMHGWSEGVDAVQGGVSDISWISADNRLGCYRVSSLYPATVDLSKQLKMDEEYLALIEGEARDNDLVPIFNSNYSYDQEWWFNKPVNEEQFSNLKGKLVRSIGPLVSEMIKSWGGKPVFIAPKEVFQSAERGVVDGVNMGVATYSSWKLWNVMPHMVDAGLFYGNMVYMMNKNRFDSLSVEDQVALLSAAKETEAWLKPRYESWVDQRIDDALKEGGTVTSISNRVKNELVNNISNSWETQLDKECSVTVSNKMKTLFSNYSI